MILNLFRKWHINKIRKNGYILVAEYYQNNQQAWYDSFISQTYYQYSSQPLKRLFNFIVCGFQK